MNRLLNGLRRIITGTRQTPEQRRHALVGPPDLWKVKRDFQITFLKRTGLLPSHQLLDLGCGTLRGGVPIIAYLEPGHYTGIESRADVLEEARKELCESGLQDQRPKLIANQGLSNLRLDDSFDRIWAFSVLIHMEDKILDQAVALAGAHLKEHAIFYANVNIGQKSQGHWQGFPVVYRSLSFYEEVCSKHGLKAADIGPLHELGHVSGVDSADKQRMLEITKA